MLLGLWLMLGLCSLNVLVLHESSLVPDLTYGSETMIWREKERSTQRSAGYQDNG